MLPRQSDEPPTDGQRLLYALGQLFRLHRAGELPTCPADFEIPDLARIIGVPVEFVTDGPQGVSFHLAREVLVLDPSQAFPWALMTLGEWAMVEEVIELGGEVAD